MTASRIGGVVSLALALALAGCGGYVEEEEAGAEGAAAPTAAVSTGDTAPSTDTAPVRPATGGAGTGVRRPRGFLATVPPNTMGASADGLARGGSWKVLDWGNPGNVSSPRWGRDAEDVALVVKLQGGTEDKTAVSRQLRLAVADKGTLRMDVYNATKRQVPIAIAIITVAGGERAFFESQRQALRPGWSRTTFDLSASTFECASSDWKHTAAIKDKDSVREIVLLFYGEKAPAAGVKAPPAGQKAGTLAIDSIEVQGRLEGGGAN
ncbi:MAG: hypothetical protein ACYS9X_31180 [Planctomycetota bacterium]|jgi:hypothetical protein